MKIAVVTPYCREDPATLERCIASVRAQEPRCTHYLVADGHPDPALQRGGAGLRHLTLPLAHGDYGGVARALGSLRAAADGCDAILWLDADNWFEPDHVATMLQYHRDTGRPLVSCWRILRRPDTSRILVDPEPETRGDHVDTNCWFVTRPAFSLLTVWLMPVGLSVIGDRILFEAARRKRLAVAMTRQRTVNYTSMYRDHYDRLKETPPPGAKSGILKAGLDYLARPANRAGIVAALGFMPHGMGPGNDVEPAAAG